MQAAAQEIGNLITNQITVNIGVGWNEFNGTSISGSGESLGAPSTSVGMTYAQVKAELEANISSAADGAAIASMPTVDPTNGGMIDIYPAQEKAWGLLPANGSEIDGSVGFGAYPLYNFDPNNRSDPNGLDFIGVAEHELTHVLGRISELQDSGSPSHWSVSDLFRYDSAGALATAASSSSYFSINGGTTALNGYHVDTSSDYADWAGTTPDSFDATSRFGVENPITPTDDTLLSVLGFDVPSLACFAKGTRIATPGGDVPVEELQTGSRVVTHSGDAAPVVWLGLLPH